MSARVDTGCSVYYCLTCGPCLQLLGEESDILVHNDVEHPQGDIFYEYEEVLH